MNEETNPLAQIPLRGRRAKFVEPEMGEPKRGSKQYLMQQLEYFGVDFSPKETILASSYAKATSPFSVSSYTLYSSVMVIPLCQK